MNLLLHPAFKRLLQVKWSIFAQRKHFVNFFLQLFFVLLWSIVGVTTPTDSSLEYSKPIAHVWWRMVLESLAVSMTFYFIIVVSNCVHKLKRICVIGPLTCGSKKNNWILGAWLIYDPYDYNKECH